jgi:hypothetical protein
MNFSVNELADRVSSSSLSLSRKDFAALALQRNIGKEHTTLLHYHTFLIRLRRNANVDQRILKDTIDQSTQPSAREIQQIMKKEVERNPFGVMRRAMRLKSKMRRNPAFLGTNEVRRICLGELIQTVRTDAGLGRDNSNNKASSTALWNTFLKAKERVAAESYPLAEESVIEARSKRLREKSTRALRKRENHRQHQLRSLAQARKRRSPTWYLAPHNPITEVWLSKKLKKWAKRCKVRFCGKRLEEAKEGITAHYWAAEKLAGDVDPNIIRAALWNVDKNAKHVRDALSVLDPSPIPPDVNVLCVVEASMGRKIVKPQVIQGWVSSTVGNCQILVRKPASLHELDFDKPPKVDDEARDSTEFLACRVKANGQSFTTISAYFPPSLKTKPRIMEVFRTFARGCMKELTNGPVVFGTDLNFEFRERVGKHHNWTKIRQNVWNQVWRDALDGGKGTLTPLSKSDAATHFPAKGAPACLDMLFLLTSTESPATAYTSLAEIKQVQTAHQLTTGSFSIHKPPPRPKPQEAPAEERVHWDKIRYDKEKRNEFQPKLEEKLLRLVTEGTFDAKSITETIVEVGKSVLGTSKGGANPKKSPGKGNNSRNQPWWDAELKQKARAVSVQRRKAEECVAKIKKKLMLKEPPPTDLSNLQDELVVLRRNLAKLIVDLRRIRNDKRRNYYDNMAASKTMKNPDHVSAAHKIRKKVLGLRSGQSNEVRHSAKVMNQEWSKIFEGLVQGEPPNAQFLEDILDGVREQSEGEEAIEIVITKEHVLKAKKGLKLNKAPGLDGITNEALRLISDDTLIKEFAKLFSAMINDPTKIPPEWKRGLIALIPKKDNPDPLDYRPIALLSHMAKFMELAVKAYLEEEFNAEKLIAVYQMGFRVGRGTEEASLTLMAIDEICRQQKKPLIAIFLDIKKAYDSVPAKVMAASLQRMGIHSRLIRFLFEWISGHERKLMMPGNDGEKAWLKLLVGVPQGSILAPFLFACVMDTLDAYLKGEAALGLEVDTPSPALDITPMVNTWREMMYADDTTIFNHSITDSNIMLSKVEMWSRYSGMTFHPQKFECTRLGFPDGKGSDRFGPVATGGNGARGSIHAHTKFKGNKLPIVPKAKHLGLFKSAVPSNSPTFTIDLKKRLDKADASSSALSFAYRVGKKAATTHFASNLHRSVAEGAAYFGCALCDLSAAQVGNIRKTIGKAAKAGLGIHSSGSTTLALSYLGWQEPETVIAMRRLSLLRRTLDTAPPEITALTKTMIKSNDECFPSPYLQLLNSSVEKVVSEEVKGEHWPSTRDDWVAMLDNEGHDVTIWYGEICGGIIFNNQHPMIRASPRHAATAFRFICPSLKPFKRKTEGAVEVCQVCNQGENTGYHLLSGCCDEKMKAITDGLLLANYTKYAWSVARTTGNYNNLNEILLTEDPSLRTQDDKIKDLILIKSEGNDLDVLARILRHQLFTLERDVGRSRFRTFLKNRKIEWQDFTDKDPTSSLLKYKSELYTAYNWLGIIIDDLWSEYCTRDRPRPQQVEEEEAQGLGDDQ